MASHIQTIEARATLITLMLREDHQKVRQLFNLFDEAMNANEKRDIVTVALTALEVHGILEEELIYPVWREYVDERDLMDEARENHQVVHLLITEFKNMDSEDERYDDKFTVLREQVQHHMKEEEGKMFSRAEKADLDWERLTKQVIQRRQSLEQQPLWLLGVPVMLSANDTVCATRAVLSGRAGR